MFCLMFCLSFRNNTHTHYFFTRNGLNQNLEILSLTNLLDGGKVLGLFVVDFVS